VGATRVSRFSLSGDVMTFTTETIKHLSAKLDPAHVTAREQAGRKLHYIEGWHAIAEANRIFGFDGWTRETVSMDQAREPETVDNKWRVGYVCKVRVRVGSVVREGTGYGSGIDKDKGSAIESAVKEAETDAMKRALMTFGNPFGLALYDKSRENVGEPEPVVTLPKKDARAVYSALSLGLKQCGTVEDLAAFWRDKQAEIAALPPDWRQNLTTEKDDLKGLFAARREAAE
jgi:DNA repair and recombination protein RAD52